MKGTTLTKTATCLAFSAFLGILGCRSKLETTVSKGKSAAIEVEDGFAGQRTFYQSRSSITLQLGHDQLASAKSISISNQSTGAMLLENQSLAAVGPKLVHSGYSIAAANSDDLTQGIQIIVKFFPFAPEFKDKFKYGSNELLLEIESSNGQKHIDQEIVLRDFEAFGLGRTVRASKRKRPIEGWFGGILRPVVRSENSAHVLRSGFFHSVNH